MAKSLYLFLLLPFFLFSKSFTACELKYDVSSVEVNGTYAFAVDDSYALFYSEKLPQLPEGFTLIKRDEFLGLNLIQPRRSFKHIFQFYKNDPKELAAVLPKHSEKVTLRSDQIGLNQLAQLDKKVRNNSVIMGKCCGIVGLATEEGVIDKAYLRHFLQSESVAYNDLGIRVDDQDGVRVVEVNPFFQDSPFLLDDIIIEMDGNKAKSAAQISRDILFSKPASQHSFIVLRAGKQEKISTHTAKRTAGGKIPDTFFDLFGLELDENLTVKSDAAQYEIKKGDRLLSVMKKEVKSLKELRDTLSAEKSSEEEFIFLLFDRDNFEFFIHFPKPE